MEQRPVYQVKARVPYGSVEQPMSGELDLKCSPPLRLVLIPMDDFLCYFSGSSVTYEMDRNFTLNHFIDKLDVKVKMKRGGNGVDRVDVSFLLEDRSQLDFYRKIVVDVEKDRPIFIFGTFSDCEVQAERFT